MRKIIISLAMMIGVTLQAQAELVLNLLKSPGGLDDATHAWVFQADGSVAKQTSENSLFTGESDGLSGSLGEGVTGSFTVTVTSECEFNPEDFSSTLSTGVPGAKRPDFKWAYSKKKHDLGPVSAMNPQLTIGEGEAMVMTFDLSNLQIPPGKSFSVDGFKVCNVAASGPAGLRFSLLENGAANSIALTGVGDESTEEVGGKDVFQPINQSVNTGDKIALWSVSKAGQRRFKGFQFSIVSNPISTETVEPLVVADNMASESETVESVVAESIAPELQSSGGGPALDDVTEPTMEPEKKKGWLRKIPFLFNGDSDDPAPADMPEPTMEPTMEPEKEKGWLRIPFL